MSQQGEYIVAEDAQKSGICHSIPMGKGRPCLNSWHYDASTQIHALPHSTTCADLKNAIIKSFDDSRTTRIGEYTLQYLEDSHINFAVKDYPFIKQEVINKAIDVFNTPEHYENHQK
ncbi:1549_t:CDS:2 [Funneliformis caledonium]|uniref:1549_t:CDS:1 n=1 Tax=Funneliformis caledonium TaxID=1117310 RepID=A0A9N9NB72_9GLOM|nr:1549_t:CDS:2 [Funneliformis caledonium]